MTFRKDAASPSLFNKLLAWSTLMSKEYPLQPVFALLRRHACNETDAAVTIAGSCSPAPLQSTPSARAASLQAVKHGETALLTAGKPAVESVALQQERPEGDRRSAAQAGTCSGEAGG